MTLLLAHQQTPGLNGGRYKGLQQDATIAGTTKVENCEAATELLKQSYEAVEKTVSQYHYEACGSTASTAIITPDGFVTIAQIGDSPVVLYVKDKETGFVDVYDLTIDQSPNNERERVEAAGGYIFSQESQYAGRLFPFALAVSRAFGDLDTPGVTAKPNIHSVDLKQYLSNNKTVHVVVCSDGLNDNISLENLADAVKFNSETADICNGLIQIALNAAHTKRGKTHRSDNISASIAQIDGDIETAAIVAAMDGHGENGERISDIAAYTVWQYAAIYKPGIDISKIHVEIQNPPSSENANDVGAKTEEFDISKLMTEAPPNTAPEDDSGFELNL